MSTRTTTTLALAIDWWFWSPNIRLFFLWTKQYLEATEWITLFLLEHWTFFDNSPQHFLHGVLYRGFRNLGPPFKKAIPKFDKALLYIHDSLTLWKCLKILYNEFRKKDNDRWTNGLTLSIDKEPIRVKRDRCTVKSQI